ncbi:MAG: hypothetical protein LBU53_04615 [Zoogloeaceae bacterium]|jgi:hypothetical protein|nr:hypothetical protein [Zoogloeaceae bacterium]
MAQAEQRKLPKDELRDDAVGVFHNSDDAAEGLNLRDPEVAVAAFKAVFFNDPVVQDAQLKLS